MRLTNQLDLLHWLYYTTSISVKNGTEKRVWTSDGCHTLVDTSWRSSTESVLVVKTLSNSSFFRTKHLPRADSLIAANSLYALTRSSLGECSRETNNTFLVFIIRDRRIQRIHILRFAKTFSSYMPFLTTSSAHIPHHTLEQLHDTFRWDQWPGIATLFRRQPYDYELQLYSWGVLAFIWGVFQFNWPDLHGLTSWG